MKTIFYFMVVVSLSVSSLVAQPGTWEYINPGTFHQVKDIQCYGGYIYLNSDSGLFRSSDDGSTWLSLQIDSTDKNVLAFTLDSSGALLASTSDTMLYRSTDQGNNWQFTVKTSIPIYKLIIHPPYLYAADLPNGYQCRIYRSADSGEHFTYVNSGLFISTREWTIDSNGNILIINIGRYGNNGVLYSSSDSGSTWNDLWSTQPNTILTFTCAPNGDLLLGTSSSFAMGILGLVFRSTNNGANWTQLSAPWQLANVTALSVNSQGDIFAAIYHQGIFCSKDSGVSWIQMNDGFPSNLETYSVTTNDQFIYVFDYYNYPGLYRNTTPPVGIHENDFPIKFSLSQNYPNPFNPVTHINFALPKAGFVTLTIYDMLGREVTKLTSQQYNAGNYTIDWDASNVPTGVYIYRLQANDIVETKKLVVMR